MPDKKLPLSSSKLTSFDGRDTSGLRGPDYTDSFSGSWLLSHPPSIFDGYQEVAPPKWQCHCTALGHCLGKASLVGGWLPFTWHIQVLQVGAEGHHVKDSLVGDIVTAWDFQAPQFWAALGNGVKPSVREPPAATDSYGFQHETDVGCVLAQPAGQHLEGAVHVDGLARQANSPPEARVPGQVVPAAAHAGAAAQLVGGQEGEDLDHRVVREPLYAGLFLLGFGGQPDERVGEAGRGRGVDQGHSLPGDGGRGGGRTPSILKSGQVRWTYQGWAGRTQCAHAQVGVWQRTESKGLMKAPVEPRKEASAGWHSHSTDTYPGQTLLNPSPEAETHASFTSSRKGLTICTRVGWGCMGMGGGG